MKARNAASQTEQLAKLLRSLRSQIGDALSSLELLKQDPNVDILSTHKLIARELPEWKDLCNRVIVSLAESDRTLRPLRDQAAQELPDRLRRSLSGNGQQVYGEGATLIVNGVVHVEVDPAGPTVTLNGSPQGDLSVNALSHAITRECERVRAGITSASEFGKELLRAYEALRSAGNIAPGAQVMTLDLLPQIAMQRQSRRFLTDPAARNFAEYPAVQFRADLFNLLSNEGVAVGEHVFCWAAGSNTKGSVFMLVPSLGRAAHVGRVWFTAKGEAKE